MQLSEQFVFCLMKYIKCPVNMCPVGAKGHHCHA